MNGTLALAESIAAMSLDEVRELLRARPIAASGSVGDPLTLAIELLRPDSITRALSMVDRHALQALRALDAGDAVDPRHVSELRGHGLVGLSTDRRQPVRLSEVSAVLQHMTESTRFDEDSVASSATEPPAPRRTADTSRWFGQALSAVRLAAALLRVMSSQPARLSRKDEPIVSSVRVLAEATHSDATSTSHLLWALRAAGLVAPLETRRHGTTSSVLAPTAATEHWLTQHYPERWMSLAAAMMRSMSPHLRRALELSDSDLRRAAEETLTTEFPLLPATLREHASRFARAAEELGLSVEGTLTPPAMLLLRGEEPEALAAATRDFPAVVPGVYVQPDLSVVVPGPLTPSDELALSEIADTEQLGAAAVLRISPASLARATRHGRSTGDIRALLERLSLTGVPQPLDYMLTDLDRERDPELSHGHTQSPQRPGEVWLSLRADSAASTGTPTSLADARRVPDAHAASDDRDALALRVHTAANAPGPGDLARLIELAIRNRNTIAVTAEARGERRTFTLAPISLAGGRLRAVDQTAGVERTLPISAITAVEPLGHVD